MTEIVKCSRCRRRCRGRGAWNETFSAGVRVGYLCPDCQTPEENAEAEINFATTDCIKTTTVSGQAAAYAVVMDLVSRCEVAISKAAHQVETGTPVTVDGVVDIVERDLGPGYLSAMNGSRRELIRQVVHDCISGEMYE